MWLIGSWNLFEELGEHARFIVCNFGKFARNLLISRQATMSWIMSDWLVRWYICSSVRRVHATLTSQADEKEYRKISNIRHTLVGNKIVDHSDVVGAWPVCAAPTTSSFSTWHLAPRDSAKTAARQYENLLSVGIWSVLYKRLDGTKNASEQSCHDLDLIKSVPISSENT